MKVLFIGNSQISSNDLPRMIKTISESAPADSPRIEPGEALVQGTGLKGYWDAGEGPGSPRAMIAAGKWDYVVIQDIFCAQEDEFEEYATRFDNEVRKAGSKTILFATANVSEFYEPRYRYPEAFRKLNDMQISFGRKRGIAVAAAGYAWMKYWGPNPSEAERLDLYAQDKGHPGVKGSYIYACLLYAHITGYNPKLLPLPDKDLDYGNDNIITRQELARMRKAAWEEYRESTGGRDASIVCAEMNKERMRSR